MIERVKFSLKLEVAATEVGGRQYTAGPFALHLGEILVEAVAVSAGPERTITPPHRAAAWLRARGLETAAEFMEQVHQYLPPAEMLVSQAVQEGA